MINEWAVKDRDILLRALEKMGKDLESLRKEFNQDG